MNFKKVKCLLICLCLVCFNNYAISIDNNNGSAFITKAEFDALKSSFQAQIDNYNLNIDSKIDNAISSYLSGIRIAKETVLYPRISNYNEICWMNNLYTKIKRRTFTSTTAYTVSEAYVTPLYEKKRAIRCGRIQIGWGIPFDVNTQYFQLSLSNPQATIDIGGGWFNTHRLFASSSIQFLKINASKIVLIIT